MLMLAAGDFLCCSTVLWRRLVRVSARRRDSVFRAAVPLMGSAELRPPGETGALVR